MPYNNSGYPYLSSAGTGYGDQYQNYGGNRMNTNGYASNGNPNGAYNQQRQDLGRYRPPTIQSTNNGQINWNDMGGYEYNIPNSYGGGGNYYNSGQQAQYGVEGQRPQFRQDYYAQQPQIYQRGNLRDAFNQAQVASRNPNLQRPPMMSDTGGGYGNMMQEMQRLQQPERPRFQGTYGWRPQNNGGIRAGVPGGEYNPNPPTEVAGSIDNYVPDPNRGSAIPKPRPTGMRPPSFSGYRPYEGRVGIYNDPGMRY